jgi:hypothetical protein
MTSDQFWSIFAMPIGLMICFWPIVIAWMLSGRNESARNGADEKH